MCGDCFNVSGPANAMVDFFSYAAQANSTYQVAASWEASYRGAVTIGLESQRRGSRKLMCHRVASNYAPWPVIVHATAWSSQLCLYSGMPNGKGHLDMKCCSIE